MLTVTCGKSTDGCGVSRQVPVEGGVVATGVRGDVVSSVVLSLAVESCSTEVRSELLEAGMLMDRGSVTPSFSSSCIMKPDTGHRVRVAASTTHRFGEIASLYKV